MSLCHKTESLTHRFTRNVRGIKTAFYVCVCGEKWQYRESSGYFQTGPKRGAREVKRKTGVGVTPSREKEILTRYKSIQDYIDNGRL